MIVIAKASLSILLSEMFSFPAGTIAAVIIGGLVLIMILIKVVCVVTGHDNKLPEVCFPDDENKKEILLENNSCGYFFPLKIISVYSTFLQIIF